MQNINYNKMSTKNNEELKPDVSVTPAVVQDSLIPEETKEAPQVTNSAPIGTVCGCEKLNIRKAPNTNAGVVCVIAKGTEVEIDESKSTAEFYKVRSVSETEGFYGFCMKKYIAVEQEG